MGNDVLIWRRMVQHLLSEHMGLCRRRCCYSNYRPGLLLTINWVRVEHVTADLPEPHCLLTTHTHTHSMSASSCITLKELLKVSCVLSQVCVIKVI